MADVAEAAAAAGRRAEEITIVGVTKRQGPPDIRAAVAAGLRDIGENYVQEAAEKFEGLALAGLRKHFIGHVQTNKAKKIAAIFDIVQSVDRPEAGRALAKAARALGKELAVLVQINISPVDRFGCLPEAAPALAEALRAEPGLRVEGVMAIGPDGANSAENLRAFQLAAKTFASVGGNTLSIGMSGDWREAVRCGSTMIRIGTSLFGARGLREPET